MFCSSMGRLKSKQQSYIFNFIKRDCLLCNLCVIDHKTNGEMSNDKYISQTFEFESLDPDVKDELSVIIPEVNRLLSA